MTDFNAEQTVVINMLRSMKEAADALSSSHSMRNKILESFEDLRVLFAQKVARDLINDKLMFKKVN